MPLDALHQVTTVALATDILAFNLLQVGRCCHGYCDCHCVISCHCHMGTDRRPCSSLVVNILQCVCDNAYQWLLNDALSCVPSLLAPQDPHCSGRELFLQCACDVRTILAHAVKCGGSRGASPPWFQDVVLRWAWLSAPPMERKDEVRGRPTSLYTHISCCLNLSASLASLLPPPLPLALLPPYSPLPSSWPLSAWYSQ